MQSNNALICFSSRRPLLRPTCRSSLAHSKMEIILIYVISILVLQAGKVIEKGNFKELLAINGKFASLWADQVSSFNNTDIKKKKPRSIVESEETEQKNPPHKIIES